MLCNVPLDGVQLQSIVSDRSPTCSTCGATDPSFAVIAYSFLSTDFVFMAIHPIHPTRSPNSPAGALLCSLCSPPLPTPFSSGPERHGGHRP